MGHELDGFSSSKGIDRSLTAADVGERLSTGGVPRKKLGKNLS